MPITLSRLLHLGLVIALEHWVPAYQPDVAFAADGSFLVAWREEQFPFLKAVVQSVSIPKAR